MNLASVISGYAASSNLCPACDTGTINDNAVQLLPSLSHLTSLSLDGSSLSYSLMELTRLKQLNSLSLDGCKSITDEHLQHLSSMQSLTHINVSATDITGVSLSALQSLNTLQIEECHDISTPGFNAVLKLTNLRGLRLSGSLEALSTAALAQLSQMTQLTELRMLGHFIMRETVALLDLPNLSMLVVNGIEAGMHSPTRGSAVKQLVLDCPSSADLRGVLPLPSLESLVLRWPVAQLMEIVAQQKQLTYLGLMHIWLADSSDAGRLSSMLQSLRLLQELHLDEASILDEACLLAISGMQQLQQLWLSKTEVSGESFCLLQRCSSLRKVTLQDCTKVGRAGLMALVCKPGMQQVVVTKRLDEAPAEGQHADVQRLAAALGCELLLTNEHENPFSECFSWEDE